MRIKRIHLKEGQNLGILTGFEHTFLPLGPNPSKAEPICLIGDNGSGKSKLLECLVDIFHNLDLRYREYEPDTKARIPFTFELEYSTHVQSREINVIIRHINTKKDPAILSVGEDGREVKIISNRAILELLPQ